MHRTGKRCLALLTLSGCLATALTTAAPAQALVDYTPGASGVGDPYFPLEGNGGYDVKDYVLDLSYDPATDRLDGQAFIFATPTQNLSRFNLDLQGMEVGD